MDKEKQIQNAIQMLYDFAVEKSAPPYFLDTLQDYKDFLNNTSISIYKQEEIYNKEPIDKDNCDSCRESEYAIAANLILEDLSLYLKNPNVGLPKISDDGRTNSSLGEVKVIKKISEYVEKSSLCAEMNLRLIIPKERYWYDVALTNEKYFFPINIKLSTFAASDNCSSMLGVLWTLTGIFPESLGFKSNPGWKKCFEAINTKFGMNKNADYFFLVINKKDTTDIFHTSLKTIKYLKHNPSNLPFQCKWDENREHVRRTFDEAADYILKVLNESIMADTKQSMCKKYIWPLIYRYS